MSNWVLEFDRWAPSVVKIAYKVIMRVVIVNMREVSLYISVGPH